MHLKAWAELLRVGNCSIIAFAVLVGFVVSGGRDLASLLLPVLSVFLIAAAGNVVNDYFDYECDKISKPWRPLPSGKIKRNHAFAASLLMFATGTLLASFSNVYCFLVAILASLLLFAYSWKLKKLGFLGNLVIALLSSLAIIFGGLVVNQVPLLPAIYAFLIILGREVLKGIEDLEGDKVRQIKTVAQVAGAKVAYALSSLFLSVLILISPIPWLLGIYGVSYLVTAVLGVDVPTLVAVAKAKTCTPEDAWKATRILKIPLFAGLLAFLLGEVLRI